jgi:uncharacterized protein (TIGR02996 family)
MSTDSLCSALVAALRENPDDLAAHMAYGDYLAERGDPRGEFIQVQLALENAKLPPERRAELKRREAELLAAHQAEWLGPLAKLFQRKDGSHCTWARGWLAEACINDLGGPEACLLRDCPAASLLRSLDLPHIRHRLQPGSDEEDDEEDEGPGPRPDAPGQLVLFAEHEVPAGTPSRPSGPLSALSVLSRAAFIPNLRHLQVGPPEVGIDEEDEELPGTSLHLDSLLESALRLEVLSVGAPGARAGRLFSARLPRLQTLSLHRQSGLAPLDVLAANTGLPALKTLRIHASHHFIGTILESDNVIEFVQSSHFPALRELHLRGHDLDERGCQAIVESGILRRLRKLDLSRGTITDRGARILARCRDIRRLESFTLLYNALTARGIARLQALPIEVACEPQGGRWDGGDDDDSDPFSDDME